jgi:ABC-type phosphate transport system substrate-binding protein
MVGTLLRLPTRQMELFFVGVIIAAYNAAFHRRLKVLMRNPSAGVKQFSDFVLSQRGQDIVLQMDFVPLQKSSE